MSEFSTSRERKVLKGAAKAAVVGAGTLGIIGAAGGLERISQAENKPSEYFNGIVDISRGVNIRTSPDIPDSSEPYNNRPWEKIVLPDGQSLENVNQFEIANPLVVKGEDPAGGRNPSPWITFKDRDGSNLYISLSPQTFRFVKTEPGGHFVKGSVDENGNFDTDLGSEIPRNDLSQVSIPQAPKS